MKISLLTTMKLVFLVFLFSSVVTAQVIAPCVTQCTIDICPKGVSDHPCFCVAQALNIQKCINATCDAASIGDGEMIFQQQCISLFSMSLLTFLGGSTTGTTSSSATSSASASSISVVVNSSVSSSGLAFRFGMLTGFLATASASSATQKSDASLNILDRTWLLGVGFLVLAVFF